MSLDVTADIRRTLALLYHPGDVVELRILNTARGTVSGYYDSPQALARDAAAWDGKAPGVYATLNPVKPELLARARNRAVYRAKQTTSDTDIACRRWLPIDFDPIRPAGISSTDAEHAAALQLALEVREFLIQLGFPPDSIVLADSGNGAHLLVRIDHPNTPDASDLIKRCLQALDFRFSNDAVAVDLSTYNPSRIWKLYGTLAAKGDATVERPHRRAVLLEVPDRIEVAPIEALERLAALTPAEPTGSRATRQNGSTFDLPGWLAKHDIQISHDAPFGTGHKWILAECPMAAADHGVDRAAYVIQLANGALAAGCHHSRCTWDWGQLRARYEPDRQQQGTSAHQDDLGSQLVFTSVADLTNEPELESQWLVEGILPVGALAVVVAKPKVGKSTLLRNLCLSVASGQAFLGRVTRQGRVLYLALEDKRSQVRSHFRAIGVKKDTPLEVFVGASPTDALAQLRKCIERNPPMLVVIDPLFRFIRVKDGNDYATITTALNPILALARDTGVAVALSHHAPKAGRDDIDSPLGSTAIAGSVDTLIHIRRNGKVRSLATVQREGEDLADTVIELDPETRTLTLAGTVADLTSRVLKSAILTFIESRKAPVTESVIKDSVEGRNQDKVAALRLLVETGELSRTGGGKRGDPYLYSLSGSLVPQATDLNGNENPESRKTPSDSSDFSENCGSRDHTPTREPAMDREPESEEIFTETDRIHKGDPYLHSNSSSLVPHGTRNNGNPNPEPRRTSTNSSTIGHNSSSRDRASTMGLDVHRELESGEIFTEINPADEERF